MQMMAESGAVCAQFGGGDPHSAHSVPGTKHLLPAWLVIKIK
jgi:hypothetical protein